MSHSKKDSIPLLSTTEISYLSNSKHTKQWTTFKLTLLFISGCIFGAIISNIDRFISWIETSDKSNSSSVPNFGHEMYEYFKLDEEWREMYFNWGSWGGIPIPVMNASQQLYDTVANCPNCYFSFDRAGLLTETLQLLAEYLGIDDWQDLVFVDNASQGISTILRSISEMIYNIQCTGNTTCKILTFNTAHPVVENTVEFIDNSLSSPVSQEIIFDVTFSMLTNTTQLLNALRIFIEEHNNENTTIYMASISHITASPATIYDVGKINALFGEYNITTLIDGAQAMGQIKLNFSEMNPDIYIANGYKWLYSLRGSAVLYVKKEFQDFIYPVVISTTNALTATFQQRFQWLGCKDYVPWITMKNALEFRQSIGDDAIIEYIHDMAVRGGKRVAEIWWGDEKGIYIENEQHVGAMVNVLMPPNNLTSWSNAFARDYNIWIRVDNNVFGDMVARFSTQIFHEIEDFERAAYIVLEIIKSHHVDL